MEAFPVEVPDIILSSNTVQKNDASLISNFPSGILDEEDILSPNWDPMAPLDFGGVDLNQIVGFESADEANEGDFGIVPKEPIVDGMVPEVTFSSHFDSITVTTGATAALPPPSSRSFKKQFSPLITSLPAVVPVVTTANAPRKAPKEKSGPSGRRSYRPPAPLPDANNEPKNRGEILARWREKKARRNFNRPRVQYESRKRTALEKKRINGKFVSAEKFQEWLLAEQEKEKDLHMVPL